ncbi:hypothetical protein EVG20_g6987 [Dentipellis fragilis]|uniref:Uncharacterized protein n=1 Tax=Dentipellis fragilis TaxID=205917 RepID=A0A4Y9YHK6_9AGAM|nr:hypothetical protein EVG20_g6987 [Dentipellis fragilis]
MTSLIQAQNVSEPPLSLRFPCVVRWGHCECLLFDQIHVAAAVPPCDASSGSRIPRAPHATDGASPVFLAGLLLSLAQLTLIYISLSGEYFEGHRPIPFLIAIIFDERPNALSSQYTIPLRVAHEAECLARKISRGNKPATPGSRASQELNDASRLIVSSSLHTRGLLQSALLSQLPRGALMAFAVTGLTLEQALTVLEAWQALDYTDDIATPMNTLLAEVQAAVPTDSGPDTSTSRSTPTTRSSQGALNPSARAAVLSIRAPREDVQTKRKHPEGSDGEPPEGHDPPPGGNTRNAKKLKKDKANLKQALRDEVALGVTSHLAGVVGEVASVVQTINVYQAAATLESFFNGEQSRADINTEIKTIINACKESCQIASVAAVKAVCNWMRVARVVSASGLSPHVFYSQEVQLKGFDKLVARQTFVDWHDNGMKCARLAYGGSIYFVVVLVLACGRERVKNIHKDEVIKFSHLIRFADPKNALTETDKAAVQLIQKSIFPAMTIIRKTWKVDANLIFGRQFLQKYGFDDALDLTDLDQSDKFFGGYQFNTFDYPPREHAPWSLELENFHMQSLKAKVYETQFNSLHEENMKPPFEKGGNIHQAVRDKVWKWTEDRRKEAEKEKPCMSHKGLKARLRNRYDAKGVRKNPDSYIHIHRKLADERPLQLLDSNGKNLLLWDATMPEDLRDHTLAAVKAAMSAEEGHMNRIDSRLRGKDGRMESLHFSTYNRMHTPGDDFPKDAYPYMVRRYRGDEEIRTNHNQMTPYASMDLVENQAIYNGLVMALKPMFEWLFETVKLNMPSEEIEALEIIVERMPLSTTSPFHPWSSMVVNFRAITPAHRDWSDKNLCGVFALGEFEGGELVLYEPGLIIPMQSGDFVIFPSARTTHFNLHCKGSRMSFVFKTDLAYSRWVKNMNGFEDNAFMPPFATTT